jgi:EAL domain-containing protein (putative c-di-GMP-specific phosphodiesterase class I)
MGVLQELRDLGVGLGIDAFGVGYSSLTYLRRFPVDRLKIDRSFVSRVGHDDGDPQGGGNEKAMVAAIVGLAHLLGLWVIADGVETQAELDWLRLSECDVAGGSLLAPAATADEVTALLTGGPLR